MREILSLDYKEKYLLQTIEGGYRGGPGDSKC